MDSEPTIRPCGSSWEYCDGICTGCAKSKTLVSNTSNYEYEEVYHKETTTDGKTRWFGVYSGEHIMGGNMK